MPQLWQALSIRQPWATLVVHGIKSIEVRSWLTGKRGKILIHASKTPDPDPEAWKLITTPALMETAALAGGILGVAELCECITYPTRAAYAADAAKHRTAAERWRPPALYGFRFRHARPVAFVPWLGNTNFFGVEADIDPKKLLQPRLKPVAKLIVRLPEDGPR